jgi:predicted HD superfamily hydrolase involved in NAD metabolism
LQEIINRIKDRVSRLPIGLQSHIYRVEDIAVRLSANYDLDPNLARLGALCHDVARAMSDQELLFEASRMGLSICDVERKIPILLHGPVGSEIIRTQDSVENEAILEAVCWHTSGSSTLDTLGKIVFLSDKLDPEKVAKYPYQAQLYKLANADLDAAMLEFLNREVDTLNMRGALIHPGMIDALEYFSIECSK